jgi:hypothetical protein
MDAGERQYSCPNDGTVFTPEMVDQVHRLGRARIRCPVCEEIVSLRDDYELVSRTDQATAAMDASADAGREIQAAARHKPDRGGAHPRPGPARGAAVARRHPRRHAGTVPRRHRPVLRAVRFGVSMPGNS